MNSELVEQNIRAKILILIKFKVKFSTKNRHLTLPTKMKIIEIYQNLCAPLGIRPIQSSEKCRLNRKILMVYIFYGLNISFNVISVFVKANTFKEYTDYVYWLTVSCCTTLSYTVIILKMENLFEFFDVSDKIIGKSNQNRQLNVQNKIFSDFFELILGSESSKSASFYDQIDQRIEKWSKIIHFVMMKVTCSVLFIPKVLASLYIYFMKDSCENYELELPFPMW